MSLKYEALHVCRWDDHPKVSSNEALDTEIPALSYTDRARQLDFPAKFGINPSTFGATTISHPEWNRASDWHSELKVQGPSRTCNEIKEEEESLSETG